MKKIKSYLKLILPIMPILAGILLLFPANAGLIRLRKPLAIELSEKYTAQKSPIAITNVNVIPMDENRILPAQTVLINNGIIEEIGGQEQITVPDEALQIDGTGKFLIPGLVDMHVHIKEQNELLLFLANGVTTVRNMWGGEGALRLVGFPEHIKMRDDIQSGRLIGPTLYTTGPIMEGPPPMMPLMQVFKSPAEAIASVQQQSVQGYDFIKVYDNLDQETYRAIISEAKTLGLDVVGHIPGQVGLETALNNGQTTIEHLTGYIDPDAAQFIIPEAELKEFAILTRDLGAWNCPTLGVYQMSVPDEDLHYLDDRPEMVYVSPAMKLTWKYISRPGAMNNLSYQGAYPARIREIYIRTTKILHENGAKFVLGTDTDNPYLVPGFSLLDEVDYMIEAGFTPYEALEAGTRNAAEAMGKMDEFGTIEVGKRADLVLLESNPLQDETAFRDRAGVVVRGQFFSKTQLDGMLTGLIRSYSPSIIERIWPAFLILAGVILGKKSSFHPSPQRLSNSSSAGTDEYPL